jgi:hypothetical protein
VQLKRHMTGAFCAAALLAGTASAQDPAGAAAATITSADVLQRLGIIAHDSMKGRDTPSPGLEKTAGYIAGEFRSFGLRPAGDSGTFIQRYPYNARRIDPAAPMIQVTRGSALSLHFARDFFVLPAEVDSVVGTPLFVGVAAPGMTMPPNARGRILVATVPDTIGAAWQGRLGAFFPLAMQSGAAGVILLLDPLVTSDALALIAGPVSEQVAPFPVFGVRSDAFAPVLRGAGIDPGSLFAATPRPAGDLSGIELRLSTPVSSAASQVPNVVGIIEGSDPVLKNEYIVFSAHMDHVGVSAPDAKGDSINNGADDDGSGTTAVVEIAQAFAAMPVKPKRSIIFLTVSGEEKGLLGSDYFTKHLPVPAAQIVADINIDMIGRNHPDSVTAIGLDYTSLGPTAKDVGAAHRELHLVIAPDRQPEEHLFERSDHFNFARKQIPAIFFTTGLHADYHRPSDEVSKIDTEKLARVAKLAFHLGNMVANAPARPTWTKAGLDVVNAANANGGGR